MAEKSSQPLVSIGIPTYNRANGNLRSVIERALAQTYQNVEVIVSDNCSSDNTSEVVQLIKDPRLRYIRHETNIGAINNFNHCLEEARGVYFQLFHDDDMIDLDFVETCISSLEPDQSVGAIFTGIRIIDNNDKTLEEHRNNATGLSPLNFVLGWFSGAVALYLPSTLYNTAGLKEVGGFKSKTDMYPDLIPTFKLIARYGRVDVADIKASFRRHADSLGSTSKIKGWVVDSLYVLDVLYELFPADRKTLKKKGTRYFCRKMYRYTSRWPKSFQRTLDFLMIYKAFGFSYSPINFFYGKNTSRRIRARMTRLFSRG